MLHSTPMLHSTLIGRDREIGQLQGFLDRVLLGQGQVAFIAGEAGSGKTALLRTFAEQAQAKQDNLLVAMGNCNAQSGLGDPYLPFRELLAILTGLSAGQTAQTTEGAAANRLKAIFVNSILVLIETAPDLIGTFVPGASILGKVGKEVADKAGWLEKLTRMGKRSPAAAAGAPVVEQSRIFEQYTDFLLTLATSHPLLLILDDLQWADDASIAFLFHLSRSIAQSRILLLGAYRPDEVAQPRRDSQGNEQRHPLEKVLNEIKRNTGDVVIDLGEVQAASGRAFTDQLIDAQPNRLDEKFRAALFERTAGNALFTLELLRTLQEGGGLHRDEQNRWVVTDSLDWEMVPARVEGVLEERLGRLDESERALLDAASVEGEQFIVEVLAQVQQLSLLQTLKYLTQELDKRHLLVRELGDLQLSERQLARYQFIHALFQQFCYQELGAAQRRLLHGEVARTLENIGTEKPDTGDLDTLSVKLAWHYERAGLPKQAIVYYTRAGMVALRVSATNQAIANFRKALALLADLPASPERDKQELSLQMTLAAAARSISWLAPEVSQALNRALELSPKMEDSKQQFWPLWSLQQIHFVRGEIRQVQELSPRLFAIAEQNPALLLAAHFSSGAASFLLGELQAAESDMSQVIPLYNAELDDMLVARTGLDLRVQVVAASSHLLWLLGRSDEALRAGQSAVAIAEQKAHPASQVQALSYLALLHILRREDDAAQVRAEATLALASHHDTTYYRFWIPLLRWTQAWAHPGQEEIGTLRQVLDDFYNAGVRLRWPFILSLLARVYTKTEQFDAGLEAIDRALAAAAQQQECWWNAELHRLRGELLLAQGADLQQVEAAFQEALTIARQQHARALELRAATSLARLWRQNQTVQARQMLETVYQPFDQGFDTLDLQEAKALLAEIS